MIVQPYVNHNTLKSMIKTSKHETINYLNGKNDITYDQIKDVEYVFTGMGISCSVIDGVIRLGGY